MSNLCRCLGGAVFRCFHQCAFFLLLAPLNHFRLGRIGQIHRVLGRIVVAVAIAIPVTALALLVAVAISVLPRRAFAITLGLALTVQALLLLTMAIHFALRFGKKPQIMFGMLLEILGRHAVVPERRIPRKLVIFINNLLGGSTNLTLWPRTIEDPINDVSKIAALVRIVAVRFGPRA